MTIEPHYLIFTAGTSGDLHPFMSLALALKNQGRHVTFITMSYHVKAVERAGLEVIGIGTDEDYLRLISNPDLWDPKKSFGVVFADYQEASEQMLAQIESIKSAAPMIVIAHPFVVPAAAIARERGLVRAVVGVYLAPSNLRTCYDPLMIGPTRIPRWLPMSWRRALWRYVEQGWVDPVAVPQINAVRASFGLAKVTSFLNEVLDAPDLSLGLFPEWFAPTMPDWPQPMLCGDFPLFDAHASDDFSPELEAFLAAGDKPIIVTAGTGNVHAADLFTTALTAITKLGRRAIFLSKDRAQIPANLPPNVIWQAYVPLAALLPQVAILIHHGGIGTTAEALRAGVPQLVTPFAWDQFDNGARVAALGVGMTQPAKKLSSRKLERVLQALLESAEIRARCSQVAARFADAGTVQALCLEMEQTLAAKVDEKPPIKDITNASTDSVPLQ
jgi:rhamnosyltransferase subunit B